MKIIIRIHVVFVFSRALSFFVSLSLSRGNSFAQLSRKALTADSDGGAQSIGPSTKIPLGGTPAEKKGCC